jgi:PelA/Pel-15E family pectate lyase
VKYIISHITLCVAAIILLQSRACAQDSVADNMLMFQRVDGGWPKHLGNSKIDYNKTYTVAERAAILDDSSRNDATIDNNATSKEIRYLLKAFRKTNNKKYLQAAERGVAYLLQMQDEVGGWPQFYPDSSSYRNEITYNDNAMINAMNILWDLVHGEENFKVVDSKYKQPAEEAISKGINCILKTQIKVRGKLTAWCAQYDKNTLQPAKARAYELPSISGAESVGVVQFLMKLKHPSKQVKEAVAGAVEWFNNSKIIGYNYIDVKDSTQPTGRDRILVPAEGGVLWARFYDIETNRPFFCGRDGVKKYNVAEIENERRAGYMWYGTWPKEMLEKYPAWAKKNL